MIDIKKAKLAYKSQKFSCQKRIDRNSNPIEMRMTFDEWLDVWQKSGKWDQRGRQRNQYVMARKDDIGHYEIHNVIIQPVNTNCITRNKNTVWNDRKGKNNPAYGRTLPKVTCPHCNKIVDIANLNRWHKHED